MMPYFHQTQELTISAFPLSQVVIAIAMVVSSVVVTGLISGLLPSLSSPPPMPMFTACSAIIAMWRGTAAISRKVLPSVALGIDYFTI